MNFYKVFYCISDGKADPGLWPVFASTELTCPIRPHSAAFFCSTCGEVWARVEVGGEPQTWDVQSAPCERHTPQAVYDWGKRPGSMLHWSINKHTTSTMFWPLTLEVMPREMLLRELRLLVDLDNSTLRIYNDSTLQHEPLPMELTQRIAELRSKVLSNTVTNEELREAYAALRAARTSASVVREQKKAAAAKPDGSALLAKLAAFANKS